MFGALNANFITLIQKKDNLFSFNDFIPIALCNLIYKMISKIIVDRLKPFLSKFISKEQFGFLDNRQVLDAIGTTQECLHTVKAKNIRSVVMKLGLAKAYDKVNWDFLRLVLLQIGILANVIN